MVLPSPQAQCWSFPDPRHPDALTKEILTVSLPFFFESIDGIKDSFNRCFFLSAAAAFPVPPHSKPRSPRRRNAVLPPVFFSFLFFRERRTQLLPLFFDAFLKDGSFLSTAPFPGPPCFLSERKTGSFFLSTFFHPLRMPFLFPACDQRVGLPSPFRGPFSFCEHKELFSICFFPSHHRLLVCFMSPPFACLLKEGAPLDFFLYGIKKRHYPFPPISRAFPLRSATLFSILPR